MNTSMHYALKKKNPYTSLNCNQLQVICGVEDRLDAKLIIIMQTSRNKTNTFPF